MAKFENPLNDIKIASPCSADWSKMIGDERKRFCGSCNLSVYNLSGMSKAEAENLLIESEGRVCVMFYKRADGSVITKNCPVGFAKVKQRAQLFVTAAASLIFTFFGALGMQSMFGKQIGSVRDFRGPFATPTPEKLMGAIAVPSPTPKRKPKPSPTPEPKVLMGKPSAPSPKDRVVTMGEVAPRNG